MGIVYIPDPNLKAAINYELNPTRPPEQDITDEEMQSLEHLNASDRGIVDLTGMQTAKNINSITLFKNKIFDLSPLSLLEKLEYLDLQNNEITDITPLSSITSLRSLYLIRNKLTDIRALSLLINLDNLYLYYNEIIDIEPLRPLTKLTLLGLAYNQITDISAVSSLINLRYFISANNQITDISPIKSLINLSIVNLSNNKIIDISPVSLLVNLISLSLFNNKIKDISPLKSLTNLTRIYLYTNEITDISALSSLTKLERIDLSINKINDITPLSSLINIVSLGLSNNQIADLTPLKPLTKLVTFSASNQTITNKGTWSNGTLVISTSILKNIDGTNPSIIQNITPTSGVYDSVDKNVIWNQISYNEEATFTFKGEMTFSGTVIRRGNTGPKALQLQMSNKCNTIINYGEPIIFNKTIYASDTIRYNDVTGSITLTTAGLYSISWWVAGITSVSNAIFAIDVIGGEQIIGNANNYPGQVNGNAIIEVIQGPMEIRLINLTTRCEKSVWVSLSHSVPVQANISIVDYFNYY